MSKILEKYWKMGQLENIGKILTKNKLENIDKRANLKVLENVDKLGNIGKILTNLKYWQKC